MKKFIHRLPLLFFAALVFMLQGCLKDTLTTTYTSFEPVYKSKAEVFQDIKSGQPQPLTQTGKLALYGNYIFVNEVNRGVHVIDNSNPAAPQNIAFIHIPGNIDLALKNNILYADIYTDMVAIDISDPHQVVLKKVSHEVFPERQYPGGFTGDSSRYIVDWIKHETSDKAEIDKFKQFVGTGIWLEDGLAMSGSYNAPASASSSGQSIGGSMARFTIVGNYLYTVGLSALSTFNISTAADPVLQNVQSLGWNIETIYPLNNKLFIGSQTGMFIFNIDNPAQPAMLSTFSHACFSDPVIANDQYAFVTLKAMTGISTCWGVAPQRNEMDIVDITDITSPVLVKIYDMEEPMGLSMSGHHLFLCDGKGGLKVYDATDVVNLNLLSTFTDINPFDVITHNGIAIVVAKEGLIQYDYSDINNIRKLSAITINRK
jgi:hypothetical protein